MLTFPFYDARGNTYFVATPTDVRSFVAVPETAPGAAQAYKSWTETVSAHVRADSRNADGLLVGPFPEEDGCGLLIVNTDGSLAEFSGNGLTIFSQFLVDSTNRDRSRTFFVNVHHDRSRPIRAKIVPEEHDGKEGFQIGMVPTFGPEAVEASSPGFGISELNGRTVSLVYALAHIDPAWTCSQFVSVGNPHCVTFLSSVASLTSLEERGAALTADLTAIAYSSVSGASLGKGRPCKNGVNLQWAFVAGPGEIYARVFERGEGWTRSSGSSATAVASAARHVGLVSEMTVRVAMPGGVAPLRLEESNGRLERVLLFGEARRVS